MSSLWVKKTQVSVVEKRVEGGMVGLQFEPKAFDAPSVGRSTVSKLPPPRQPPKALENGSLPSNPSQKLGNFTATVL